MSAARLVTKLPTAPHAEHDLAAHSACDGGKDLPNAFFSSLTLSLSLLISYHVASVPALNAQEGIAVPSVFQAKCLVSFVNAFFQSDFTLVKLRQ